MKTLLISPMWLDYPTAMKRHEKWLDWTTPLKDKLGYDEIFFVDNASDKTKLVELQEKYGFSYHRCDVHIARKASHAYGYWYSALAIAARYAIDHGYEKIIYIDTDMYPLTSEICEYTKNLKSGWTGLWCPRHNFPETNFQIIGPDQLENFYNHMSRDFLVYYPEGMAETNIPWTHVEKGFKGDRYGELAEKQTSDMHYYGQYGMEEDVELKFD